MKFGEKLKKLRNDKQWSQEQLAKKLGTSKQVISRYENGQRSPKLSIAIEYANILGINPNYFLDNNTNIIPDGFDPVPAFVNKPRLGVIACGEPILAEQNIEDYDSVPEHINCDFTLKCKGDSMIEARIMDGDIVYIKEQPTVENGEIAAVLIGDEATLKRVYLNGSSLTLLPCNSKYPPLVYNGPELENIRIIGKAVGFTSLVV